MMTAKTASRVSDHTPREINERIERETKKRISRYAAAPEADVRRRLNQLDYEWDVERAIEANASTVVAVSLLLGRFVHRGFFGLSGAVAFFLMQHALSGWCPPVSVLRRIGFRTAGEIDHERRALEQAMRAQVRAEQDAQKQPGPDSSEPPLT